jgi:hypothetical protein
MQRCSKGTLRWEQVDLFHGRLHVHRLKNGMPSVHPLTGIELRALRRLQREQKPGRYVFMSERGAPMSAVAFRRMVTRLGPTAKMPFGIHPHIRAAPGRDPGLPGSGGRRVVGKNVLHFLRSAVSFRKILTVETDYSGGPSRDRGWKIAGPPQEGQPSSAI